MVTLKVFTPIHFLGTFDLSDYETYEITIRLLNVSDDNQNNDHGRDYMLSTTKTCQYRIFLLYMRHVQAVKMGLITLDIAGGVAPYTVVLNGAEQNTLQNEGDILLSWRILITGLTISLLSIS
jgi:hypothetical protein